MLYLIYLTHIQFVEPKWTESIAVGDEAFIEKIRLQLNIRPSPGRGRQTEDGFTLAEGDFPCPYNDNFISKTSF